MNDFELCQLFLSCALFSWNSGISDRLTNSRFNMKALAHIISMNVEDGLKPQWWSGYSM
jgi:hypothetical protein